MSKCLLDSATTDRLAKIAGMFGSSHDGERAAAALKFNAALQSEGLSPADLLDRYQYLEDAVRQLSAELRSNSLPTGDPGPGGWMRKSGKLRHQSQAAECLACLRVSDWEGRFLNTVAQAENLTPKQAACLARIYARLGRRTA